MFLPVLLLLLLSAAHSSEARAVARPIAQRVVVVHVGLPPPPDAHETAAGFVSIAVREPPYKRSRDPRVLEEVDTAVFVASTDPWSFDARPTHQPTHQPTPEPTPEPTHPEQPWVLGALGAPFEWTGSGVHVLVLDAACAQGHGAMVTELVRRVAPGASIECFRVLGEDGTGTVSDVTRTLALARAFAPPSAAQLVVVLALRVAGSGSDALDAVVDYVARTQDVVVVAARGATRRAAALRVAACAHRECAGEEPTESDLLLAPGLDVFVGGRTWSGDSVSTALAAGVAAQMREAEPNMRAPWIVQRVREVAAPAQIATALSHVHAFTKPTRIADGYAWAFKDVYCTRVRVPAQWSMDDGDIVLDVSAPASGHGAWRIKGYAPHVFQVPLGQDEVEVRVNAATGVAWLDGVPFSAVRVPIDADLREHQTRVAQSENAHAVRCAANWVDEPLVAELQLAPPTMHPAALPLSESLACTGLGAERCLAHAPKCAWYGNSTGCVLATGFCGFEHPTACALAAAAGPCRWVGGAAGCVVHDAQLKRRRALLEAKPHVLPNKRTMPKHPRMHIRGRE